LVSAVFVLGTGVFVPSIARRRIAYVARKNKLPKES
jgi:hypothetical protein